MVRVECVGVKCGSCEVCWCEVWSVVCMEYVGVKCGLCGVCWCEVWFVWSMLV